MSDAKKQDKQVGKEKYVAPPYFQNREISWLEFNKRVLDQARDESVPLLERLNFCSIFWSNLQEFFMVRVGSLTDLSLVKSKIIDKKSGWTPAEQLQKIYARCHELYPYYEQTYSELVHRLKKDGVERVQIDDLSTSQKDFLDSWFESYVYPFLSPQIVNSRHPFPHLTNGDIYIIVRLNNKLTIDLKKDKAEKKAKTSGAKNVTLGIIPLPPQAQRIVALPAKEGDEGFKFVLLEDLIESYAEQIFSMYKVKHTNIVCVTRNADLDVVEGEEEQGVDYREHMKRILKKRSRLHPVRLESAKPLSDVVRKALSGRLELTDEQMFVTKVPLDMSYTYSLEKHIKSEKLKNKLVNEPFSPQWPLSINKNRSIINQLQTSEFLVSYPYESMDAFVMLLKEAAVDPAVVSIKITLYRLASHSKLAEALIAAAENGKEVTALFELRARFDESNNIEWSQQFEEAGCNVIYGFHDYKVHSKICLITRQTSDGTQYITQLGTGNYNEKTAKLYTDFCFMTTDQGIGEDAALFFQNMQMETLSDEYKELWVAPMQIKQNLLSEIDKQIALQKEGKPSGIFCKTNSITDEDVINKLVEASQAGVVTTCLVRGISCLVPGVKGYTDNICIVSIVGRLLEHSRIYIFGSMDEEVKVYLSSADLMTRNLNNRVEIAWEVKNPTLKDRILEYCGVCLSDTEKLRALREDGTYTPIRTFRTEGEMNMDSQQWLISEATRRASKPRPKDFADIHDAETEEIDVNSAAFSERATVAFNNFGRVNAPAVRKRKKQIGAVTLPDPRTTTKMTRKEIQEELSKKLPATPQNNAAEQRPKIEGVVEVRSISELENASKYVPISVLSGEAVKKEKEAAAPVQPQVTQSFSEPPQNAPQPAQTFQPAEQQQAQHGVQPTMPSISSAYSDDESFFKSYAENNTFSMPPLDAKPEGGLFKKHKKKKKKK